MGLSIAVSGLGGEILEQVDDPKNYLHRLLLAADERNISVLSKIDWYGDTYFNYLQLPGFLAEWEVLAPRTTTAEERALIDAVRRLAQRCLEKRYLLRFIGD